MINDHWTLIMNIPQDGPTRNRTENLLIKSQLLCQLSYRPSLGAAEKSSEAVGEARERLGKPIFVPHSSVSLKVSVIGNRSTHSRRAKSFNDQITVRWTSTEDHCPNSLWARSIRNASAMLSANSWCSCCCPCCGTFLVPFWGPEPSPQSTHSSVTSGIPRSFAFVTISRATSAGNFSRCGHFFIAASVTPPPSAAANCR